MRANDREETALATETAPDCDSRRRPAPSRSTIGMLIRKPITSVMRGARNVTAIPWSRGYRLKRPRTDPMTSGNPPSVQALNDAPIPVDADGSPVSLEPNCWYVCFVPGLKRQWWHPFFHRLHKHVFVIRPDGNDRWLLIESWWNRIMATTLTAEQAERFLRWGTRGSILLVREYIPGESS